MRVHIIWPILCALLAVGLLAYSVYLQSWIPAYAEAEPLYSTVAEFGSELVDSHPEAPLTDSNIKSLLVEERFESIRPYGVVFSSDVDTLISIRVNDRFSYDLDQNGIPHLIKK